MQSLFDENEYRTSDFVEAVTLRYFNHKINHIDRTDRRAVFHFANQTNTKKLLNGLREQELQVEPLSFYQCEREIKSRLYNG